MMDTDAIYSAIAGRLVSLRRGYHEDAEFYQDEIKRLLNEADAERQELLATNERLVDEVGSLKAARIAYASEFPPIHDGDDAGLPDVGRIHENIRRLKAENAELKAKLTEKASLLRGCYAADHKQKRRLAAVEADCAPYLKEGETPAERIKRALADADSLMSLYRDVVAERDSLKAENASLEEMNTQLREQNDAVGEACAKYEAELERIKALEPVAWRLLDKDPAGGSDDRWVVYTQDDFKSGVNPTEHFNIEPLYALGSKTA